ncbi:MAG: hypothetical protein ABEJ78_08325 [Haloferacaceae archaeon]
MTEPAVYDHVRATDADVPDGTYRVVGRSERRVTLLRVADADGRRVHTGDVVRVDAEEIGRFDSVGNPDGNRPLRPAVTSKLAATYWSLRAFGHELRHRPVPAAAAGGLVAVGLLGRSRLPLPDVAVGGLILVGSLALAYVGSGRLRGPASGRE